MEDYREIIYKSYLKDMDNLQLCSSDKKERNMIKKYIKRNYIPYIPNNKNIQILDLGCGKGHYIGALQMLGYKNVIGVDVSESIVNYCKKQGLNVVQDNLVNYLKVNKNKHDVIIFNDVIEHFSKSEIIKILYLLRDSLKDDGIVICKTDNEANPFTGLSGRYMDFTHEVGFVDLSIKQVFEATGFKDVKVKGADIYVFAGLLGLVFKAIAKIIYYCFFLLNCLAGRKSIHVFEKCLICIAKK
jgi:SAM-dependent methyltransferase